MADSWTLPELVAEAASWIATLPPPKNGQVRAVPDERTVRYYATLGLLDRPSAMRGRTALYGRRHLAQVVAIKRMQSAGHSLADIQGMWPTLDDVTLARMTGVTIPHQGRAGRREFWKREAQEEAEPQARPQAQAQPQPQPQPHAPAPLPPPVAITIELAPNVSVVIGVPEDRGLALTSADVRALRAAAASLVTELAHRGLTAPVAGTLEEP